MRLTRWTTSALTFTLLLLVAPGCAHNREAFYPPGGRTARNEPPLDPTTPGATRNASNARKPASTARSGETRSHDVDESADAFDFDAYRE